LGGNEFLPLLPQLKAKQVDGKRGEGVPSRRRGPREGKKRIRQGGKKKMRGGNGARQKEWGVWPNYIWEKKRKNGGGANSQAHQPPTNKFHCCSGRKQYK